MPNLVSKLASVLEPKKNDRVSLTYRLTPDAHAALKKYAKEQHRTISSIITEALLEYFEKRVKEAQKSA